MRTPLLLAFLASTALAIGLDTGKRFEFTNCDSGGSAAQTVTAGEYLLRVTDEDTWLCWAGTCATGGEKFPAGTVILLTVGRGGQSMSCRSDDDTGDAILTGTY